MVHHYSLRLQNNYCWLLTQDDGLKEKLWRSLRFRQRNYYHTALYKQKKWDGYSEFFKKESGRFLSGILPEIQDALKNLNISYNVTDERDPLKFTEFQVNHDYLNQWIEPGSDTFTLYDYQVEYINQAIKHQRGIIKAPTGGGKTACLIGILKRLPPKTPTLVMTKSTDLCHQIYRDIESWKFPDLGKCIGTRKRDFSPNIITVANVDSAHKLETLLPYFRVLLVDEVHLMMSKVPRSIYKRMNRAAMRIGFSATPFKFGGTDHCQRMELKGFFGPIIRYQGRILTTKELQERNILSRSKCVFYPIDEPELPYETYQDAVTLGIAECFSFNQIVARLAKSLKGRTLIIVERISQGETLHSLLPGSHWIHGKDSTDRREEVIDHLQNAKKCVCIVQQKLISAGLNFYIHNLINAMGSKASHDITQRYGRGLRKSLDKKIFTYYDFIFSGNRYLLDHSLQRIKTLELEGHEIDTRETVDF